MPPPGKAAGGRGARLRQEGRDLLAKGDAVIGRAKASRFGTLMTRLNAADFINSSFQFATYGLLCIFPFLIVITAAFGKDVRKVIVVRLGLNPEAARDLNGLISAGHQAADSDSTPAPTETAAQVSLK